MLTNILTQVSHRAALAGAFGLLALAALSPLSHAASGDLLWKFQTNGALWGNVKADSNSVYFGSDDGHLYALDTKRQLLNWRFATGGIVRSTPAFKGNKVFFTSDDGYLYAVDKKTGKQFWRSSLGDEDAMRIGPANEAPWEFDWGKSSPVISGGRVFVGSADGHLYAINANNGKLIWRHPAGDRVRGNPVVKGNKVYFASWDQHVYSVNAITGTLIWKHALGGRIVSSPALINDKIIVGARDAKLYALDAQTGTPLWIHSYPDGSWVESSAVAGEAPGAFFIGTSDALKLSKFDAVTGKEMWAFRTTGWTWGTPTVANGTVYIGSTGADVYWQPITRGFFAVDAHTGELSWRYEPAKIKGYVNGGVHAAPAVVAGKVFVADLDGTLYVFEE